LVGNPLYRTATPTVEARLCERQKQILAHLHFPTPAQTLARKLLLEPSG
jgi:hypothetical protein